MPGPSPRLSFGRFVSILVLLTVAASLWRIGPFDSGLRSNRASALESTPGQASAGKRRAPATRKPAGPTVLPSERPLPDDPDGDRRAVQRFIDLGLPIYCGGDRGDYVALTFDDGPGPYTEQTIRTLRRYRDTATFFLVGRNIAPWGSLPRQESELGVVGDHTWNHVPLARVSAQEGYDEVARTKQALQATTHRPVMLFRPPEGSRTTAVDRMIHSLGLLEIIWSVDSRDSAGVGTQKTYANVVAGLRPGAIILLHENRGGTLAGLESILRAVARAGYRTVTIPQLLRLDPPSLDQVKRSAAVGACVHV